MKSAPVAMISGGAKRLGASMCRILAARGYRVVVGYRSSKEEAETLADDLGARASQVDVASEASVAAWFESLDNHEGQVDLLINNVGNYNPQPVQDLVPAHWDATLQANLSGTFYTCHHALKRLREGGHIINIGSAGLQSAADIDGVDYYVGKTGVWVLTRSLAAAYAANGVRVNMISPGILVNSIDYPKDIAAHVPLGRGGELRDITQALEYLIDASYVTGVNLDVAGAYRL